MYICKTLQGVQTPSKARPDNCTGTGCFVLDFARTLHKHLLEASDQLLSLIWSLSENMKILNWKPTILLKRNHYIKCFCFIQNVANKNTNKFLKGLERFNLDNYNTLLITFSMWIKTRVKYLFAPCALQPLFFGPSILLFIKFGTCGIWKDRNGTSVLFPSKTNVQPHHPTGVGVHARHLSPCTPQYERDIHVSLSPLPHRLRGNFKKKNWDFSKKKQRVKIFLFDAESTIFLNFR